MATKTKAPEVRQNQDEDSDTFGSSATAAGKDRWLVANPTNGGHWGTDDEVADWKVLT